MQASGIGGRHGGTNSTRPTARSLESSKKELKFPEPNPRHPILIPVPVPVPVPILSNTESQSFSPTPRPEEAAGVAHELSEMAGLSLDGPTKRGLSRVRRD
jgi:hypothetical protein